MATWATLPHGRAGAQGSGSFWLRVARLVGAGQRRPYVLFVLPAMAVIAAIFHLFTHAFFKALLFLGAGSVMHAMGNVIDMRRFSGLRKVMPITHITFLCGAAALAGLSTGLIAKLGLAPWAKAKAVTSVASNPKIHVILLIVFLL